MQLDSTAAAYGLIQVVFAEVTERLAYALFILQQRQGATTFEERHRRKCTLPFRQFKAELRFTLYRKKPATLDEILRRDFSRILDEFKAELKQFDDEPSVDADLKDVRDACSELATLARWRNERIHALVRQVEDGKALYSLKTRERLSISYPECEDILHKLADIAVKLQHCLPKLLNTLDFNEKLYAAFKAQLSQ
jgi:hypothetical protein